MAISVCWIAIEGRASRLSSPCVSEKTRNLVLMLEGSAAGTLIVLRDAAVSVAAREKHNTKAEEVAMVNHDPNEITTIRCDPNPWKVQDWMVCGLRYT